MVLLGMPGFWLALIKAYIFFKFKMAFLKWYRFLEKLCTTYNYNGTGTFASLMRVVRITMLDTIRQDYITTAGTKGAPEKIVILRYALKNAMMIVIIQIGLTFTGLLACAVLTEQVFVLPGLGTLVMVITMHKLFLS